MIVRKTALTLALLSLCNVAFGAGAATPKYRVMSARDFIIDGPQLARNAVRVQVTGVYVPEGDVPVLYTDAQAAMMARYTTQTPRPPTIPLLTDDASRAFRETLYNCTTAIYSACLLEVRGRATICTLTNGFGASHESPCIMVEDGERPAPPPVAPLPPPPPPGSSTQSIGPTDPRPDNNRLLAVIHDAAFPCNAITSVQRGKTDYWRVMCGTNAYAVADIGGGRLMVQRD